MKTIILILTIISPQLYAKTSCSQKFFDYPGASKFLVAKSYLDNHSKGCLFSTTNKNGKKKFYSRDELKEEYQVLWKLEDKCYRLVKGFKRKKMNDERSIWDFIGYCGEKSEYFKAMSRIQGLTNKTGYQETQKQITKYERPLVVAINKEKKQKEAKKRKKKEAEIAYLNSPKGMMEEACEWYKQLQDWQSRMDYQERVEKESKVINLTAKRKIGSGIVWKKEKLKQWKTNYKNKTGKLQ